MFLLRVGPPGFHWDWASRLAVVGLWPLTAIVLTLFIVGGYDRRTDLLSLTYMSEHLIGMVAALLLASLLVYGFASYDFPVKPGRSTTLALRWLVMYSRQRREKTMTERLMNEILDASNGLGASVKRREDTHKMADSNKAFAHYRW